MMAKDIRRKNQERRREALGDPERRVFLSQKRMREIRWEVSLAHAWFKRNNKPKVPGFGSTTCYCGGEGCHGVPWG